MFDFLLKSLVRIANNTFLNTFWAYPAMLIFLGKKLSLLFKVLYYNKSNLGGSGYSLQVLGRASLWAFRYYPLREGYSNI